METPHTTASTSLALPHTSTRRSCPYRRTPHQRRLSVPKSASEFPVTSKRLRRTPGDHNVEKPGPLPGLVGKTWKVFYLSPLYKFATNSRSLKQYGRSLSTYIVQEADKKVAVNDDSSKECAFSKYESLRVAAADPEPVQILVTSKAGNGGKGKGSQVVLTAVLCGVDMESNPCGSLKRHFTYYPILLVKATAGLTSLLASWLASHFDCRISPLIPTSMDLAWMVAMWSGSICEGKNKPVELLYTVPEECTGLSRITYTIDASDCKVLWDSIRSEDNEEFTGDEVGAFIKSLEEHFYECFMVKLWKLDLVRVGTAVAYVGDGRLKIFSAAEAWQVLRLLSELAQEQFQLLSDVQ